MAKANAGDTASTKHSTKSTTRSIKSFKAAATSTLQNIKRKAIDIISPKKKRKKTSTIPDGADESGDNSDGEQARRPSRKASVIDVDENDSDEEVKVEPGEKDEAELSMFR